MIESAAAEVMAEYANRYPPLISVEQAAEIAHAPPATIHGWSADGAFDGFKARSGRRILLQRDCFVRYVLYGSAQPIPAPNGPEKV